MNTKILKKKNCLITGATGGIGEEISKQLAALSCNLFLTSTNKMKLEKLKNDLRKINTNIKIETFATNLNNEEKILEMIKYVRKKFASINILINCAGIFMIKSIGKSTIEDFDKSINLNVKAPFILSREFSKDMISKKWGRILLIGSSSSYSGFENGSL